MKTKTSTARRRAEAKGRASLLIEHADTALVPGDKVILCCRVSERAQDHSGTLKRQERYARAEMARREIEVVGVKTHVGSGVDPSWLTSAAAQAERLGAKLIATDATRFIRHPGYTNRDQSPQARDSELGDLKFATLGVPLVTLLHPDATSSECRAFETRIGKDAAGNSGGRPSTQQARDRKAVFDLLKKTPA